MSKVEVLHDQFERRPVTLIVADNPAFTDVYGFVGRSGRVYLEGQLFTPETRSETLLVFMHPSSSLALLPMPIALANAGFHVLCAGSRYIRNDTPLIMEKVVLDLGAYIRYAKETLGYKNVILVGWSGGGSLSLFYQSQAENSTITATPAGDPLDLTQAELIPADGVICIAAHLSRAETLSEWIDPSVMDELNPEIRDAELDIYSDNARHKPPFTDEFLTRFRTAQRARCQRITEWCLSEMERLKQSGTGEVERGFITHRTMADPRWLDPMVDPNDRASGCYLGDPKVVNTGPVGLARYSTLRAWLSQWSLTHSNARTELNAPHIHVPALVVENSADDATPAGHPQKIFNSLGSKDKTFKTIVGATHYYQEQPEKMAEAIAIFKNWLTEKHFIGASK